jgi:hypothetical protein
MRKNKLAVFMAAALVSAGASASPTQTSDSSSQSPYLVPTRNNVFTRSIITVGDAVNHKADGVTPYRMVGIPDGLGAYDNGDGTFTLLMNHELTNTNGIVRDHGFVGAFVSRWVIEKGSLKAVHGEDLIKSALRWDVPTSSYQPLNGPFSRFCSADLADPRAFYNPASGLGYNGRIYLNGEENGAAGRAWAHFLDGNTFELPALGKQSFENVLANPATGNQTVVATTDDAANGLVAVYVGNKSASPDRVAAAGLSGGNVFVISVNGVASETDATTFSSGAFTGKNLGNVTSLTGAQYKALAQANGATGFNRPEDGSWDPSNPRDFYFVTTAAFPNPAVPGSGKTRLWRLRFNDPANPAAGGTAQVLITGGQPDGPKMMDNITVNKRGTILIQEDVGSQPHIGKLWRYSISTGTLEIIAQHDPARFTPGAPGFLTQDEESSGIIPMDDILGEGWYLLDVQAHYAQDAELVEGGQLLGLHFAPGQEKK